MTNEEIMHEFLLKFKGQNKGVKIHLTDTIQKRIVKDYHFNTDDAIDYILNSGYFEFHAPDAVSLTDKGFEYSNRN